MTAPTRTPRVSDEIREQIRAGWQQGAKQKELAQRFGITQGSVSKIVTGIPKPPRLTPGRRCVDCGTPLRYKTRCEPCNQKWRVAYDQVYNRRYYLRTKQLDPLVEG
jgi:hypothetical protein